MYHIRKKRRGRCHCEEAEKRIFELQRTNQQLERLVKLIPPEVLAELQKSGRDRPRGR